VAPVNIDRRLAAILSADVVSYSRLMGADETWTLATLQAHRDKLINPKIAAHIGRVVKVMGDGLAISLTVLSVNFMGDGLRDVLDPRLPHRQGLPRLPGRPQTGNPRRLLQCLLRRSSHRDH
jgi:class 3 adenylate cyclase